jgi:hypothetical protein
MDALLECAVPGAREFLPLCPIGAVLKIDATRDP